MSGILVRVAARWRKAAEYVERFDSKSTQPDTDLAGAAPALEQIAGVDHPRIGERAADAEQLRVDVLAVELQTARQGGSIN